MTCKIVPEMTYNVSSGTLSLYTTYLACTISKLWPIIGQIFASDGSASLNTITGGDQLRISE